MSSDLLVQGKQFPKDRTIYVSEVDFEVTEKQVEQSFRMFGQIELIQVKTLGKKKSLFISFKDVQSAMTAMQAAGTIQVGGKTVRINQFLEMSQLERDANIFIEELTPDWDEKKLKEALSQYGTILSAKVNYFVGKPFGVAYIQFDTKESAAKCLEDEAKHSFKIKKYQWNKAKLSHEKTTLYIRDILNSKNDETLEEDLRKHFAQFGEVENIQVSQKGAEKPFAFLKFQEQEQAELALLSEKQFRNQKLLINWVIRPNDSDIEANLFTKNLKEHVTEDQLFQAISSVVPVNSVQLLKNRSFDIQKQTQKACIYLQSSESGKKLIDLAVKTPEIFSLYENNAVYISPFQKETDRSEFREMKRKSNAKYQQSRGVFMEPQPYQQYNQPGPQQYPQYQNTYNVNYNYNFNQPRQKNPNYQGRNNNYNGFNGQNRQQFNNGYQQQGFQNPQYQQQQFPTQQHFHQPQQNQYPQNQPYQHQPRYQQNNQQQYGHQQQQHRQYVPPPPQVQPLNEQLLTQLKDNGQVDKVNQTIGSQLYPLVLQQVGDPTKAGKYTAVFLDFDNYTVGEMIKLVTDQTYLRTNIQDLTQEMSQLQ